MAKFSKKDPGTLPHLTGLHLICDKALGSAPDFYVSHHHMRSNLTLSINMKNKQIFNKRETSCLVVYDKGFTSQLCLLATTQPAITCSKLAIETLEQGVKYVQS